MEAIDKLLNSQNVSIRYRALTELLNENESNPDVKKLLNEIPNSLPVKTLLNKMHPDGYWLQKNPRTGEILGDGVEYGSYATTHFVLSYLMELGLTKNHPLVRKASERYLNLQAEDGDWWLHMSCLHGFNIRTFVRLGYKDDPRIWKSVELMLNTNRKDCGYLCDMHEKKRKNKKSCYRGSLKMLLAFSELPEVWEHKRVKELIEYFMNRKGIFNSKLNKYVNKDVERISFPFTWGANNWEMLLALSKMGYGNDPCLNEAWELLESRKQDEGLYYLDYTPGQSPLKVGAKGLPNEWITFYILLAKMFRDAEK